MKPGPCVCHQTENSWTWCPQHRPEPAAEIEGWYVIWRPADSRIARMTGGLADRKCAELYGDAMRQQGHHVVAVFPAERIGRLVEDSAAGPSELPLDKMAKQAAEVLKYYSGWGVRGDLACHVLALIEEVRRLQADTISRG